MKKCNEKIYNQIASAADSLRGANMTVSDYKAFKKLLKTIKNTILLPSATLALMEK